MAQHHRTVTELSAEAADAARFVSRQLEKVDLDRLIVTDGHIDIDQVRALQTPLLAIQLRIEGVQAIVRDLDSRWLIPLVADRIDDLADELADQRQRSDDALTVALVAPGVPDADEVRTYFIGFTTPAEARGSGGLMENWAEMTVTDGQIEMSRFGRADDLDLGGDPDVRRFSTGDGSGLAVVGYPSSDAPCADPPGESSPPTTVCEPGQDDDNPAEDCTPACVPAQHSASDPADDCTLPRTGDGPGTAVILVVGASLAGLLFLTAAQRRRHPVGSPAAG